jgi:glutamate/tyrosine decarboxylase-like PLP-dependent enzyme
VSEGFEAGLDLDPEKRRRLWRRLTTTIEEYRESVGELRVTPDLDPVALRARIAAFDFTLPLDPEAALAVLADGLTRDQVHTAHPRYFGLFNPAPTDMGVAADALVAAFNPQLAAWSHSPFAAEVEQHLIRSFGGKFGWRPAETEGTFTSGGAEANHTGLLLALFRAFPEIGRQGLAALFRRPTLYVSAEAHDSLAKAARLSGLGLDAVREIGVDAELRMLPDELARSIEADRAAGFAPFLIAATAGTTAGGAIDPLPEIATLAEAEGLWLHVDAAWGGAAVLVPELAASLRGIERADSITFDAHKWLSVPMAAGLFLTRHAGLLERTFRVAAGYMPSDAGRFAGASAVADPFAHSLQWSRRFIGAKVFLSLLVAGWEGYAAALGRQAGMGDLLRERLVEEGWRLTHRTPLPVVCFVDPVRSDRASLDRIAERVVGSGAAWINVVELSGLGPALRACVTNYRTGPEDVEALVRALGAARS